MVIIIDKTPGNLEILFLKKISMIQFDFWFSVSNSVLGRKYNLVISEMFLLSNPAILLWLHLYILFRSLVYIPIHGLSVKFSHRVRWKFCSYHTFSWRVERRRHPGPGELFFQCGGTVLGPMSSIIDGDHSGWGSALTSPLSLWETQGVSGHIAPKSPHQHLVRCQFPEKELKRH